MSIQDAMKDAAKQLEHQSKMVYYRSHPDEWVKDRLGGYLWSKQAEIALSVVKNKRTAVKSSNGVGKSYLAAILACWWLDVHPVGRALVISTAPTYVQVTRILWRYVRRFHQEAGLYGSITQTNEWKSPDGTLMGFGRKPNDDDISGFQGYHEDYILAIADEAGGISETLYTGLEAITTNDDARILTIGNPDNRGTEFHKTFSSPDDIWTKFTISAFDTPTFTGEKVPDSIRRGLTSKQWVEERRRDWGEDSPRYQAKVMGQFPDQSENTLFSQTVLARAIDLELMLSTESTPVLGCDIARFGSDFSTVYSYQDGVLRLVDSWSMTDTVASAERIQQHAFRLGAREVRVDGVGIGAGVIDNLARISDNRFEVVGMVGNASSPDLDKWLNARAYWYDTMREKMQKSRLDMDFEDRKLKEELEGIQYTFTKHGAIQIESKDDMKKRGIKSPDFADAAMYACAEIGIDPNDPISKVMPGDEFTLELEQLLLAEELSISPY